MDELDVGRREAHKRATRGALRDAARTLFAQRGYEATSVRDIASVAGVTERTFYRYFEGKEELIAEEAFEWLTRLHDAICERPGSEPPLIAVRLAIADVIREADPATSGLWPFAAPGRPFALLRRVTPRPLLRAERAIASAILARQLPSEDEERSAATEQTRLNAELASRICVAALRTAVIWGQELTERGEVSPPLSELVDECFAALPELMHS